MKFGPTLLLNIFLLRTNLSNGFVSFKEGLKLL